MPESVVTRPRPRRDAAYTDTAALNDIHAILTGGGRPADSALADITEALARAGRPMIRGRNIDAAVTDSPTGWPVVRVDAEDTTVTVRQDPVGPGLLIEITTSTAAEPDLLVVVLDGQRLPHLCPPGGHAG